MVGDGAVGVAEHGAAVGFLFAEGVIASRDDISRVAHCGRPDQEGFGNTIDVAPAAGAEFDVERVSSIRLFVRTVFRRTRSIKTAWMYSRTSFTQHCFTTSIYRRSSYAGW